MIYHLLGEEVLVARAPQRLRDGVPVRDVARDRSDVHFERRVAMVRRAPRVRGLIAENPLSYCVELRVVVVELLVSQKYNSRFGLRFLDLPATLALLDAKARGEVAVGV